MGAGATGGGDTGDIGQCGSRDGVRLWEAGTADAELPATVQAETVDAAVTAERERNSISRGRHRDAGERRGRRGKNLDRRGLRRQCGGVAKLAAPTVAPRPQRAVGLHRERMVLA